MKTRQKPDPFTIRQLKLACVRLGYEVSATHLSGHGVTFKLAPDLLLTAVLRGIRAKKWGMVG